MKNFCLVLFCLLFGSFSAAQVKKNNVIPRIEPGNCIVEADKSLKTECGYLVVPEKWSNLRGSTIKLPYVRVFSSAKEKKADPIFMMTGGPGYSSVVSAKGLTEPLIKGRDYVSLDQRGTINTIPNLVCSEIDAAVARSYRENLSKAKLILDAVRECHKKLVGRGIDLSAYNTRESAADIEALRNLLNIDSINLVGISYSGDLMLTYLRYYPKHVRSMILDSPLPGFVNYDEGGLFNFNEAISHVFDAYENDSTEKKKIRQSTCGFQAIFFKSRR